MSLPGLIQKAFRLAAGGLLAAALACSGAEADPAAASVPVSTNSVPKSNTSKRDSLMAADVKAVESILGKPTGKMKTSQGALWLYPQWRVQFNQQGLVVKVEEDHPHKPAQVDPRVIAAAVAADKAVADRAAAEDEARLRALLQVAGKVRVVSNEGQEVDLPSLLTEGKVTIVDFYADWCGPCKVLAPKLEGLIKDDPDVVLLKIDIKQWETPVTKQFKIESVPNVRVFNRTKAQVGEPSSDLQQITANIQAAKG